MKTILLLTIAAVQMMAADATGTWTGTLTRAGQDEPRPAHIVLKQNGSQLTGTAGPNAGEQYPIQNGRVQNETLTFEVPAGDNLMKFTLKQEGDEIKGDIARDHDGETQHAKLAVKRENSAK